MDLHVFLDRNIWQASIMLANNYTRNEENVCLRNWEEIDEWGTQDENHDHSKKINVLDKSDTDNTLATLKIEELEISTPFNPNNPLNKFSESSEMNCSSIYPEATEKSDVESLDEMKESFVPVVVGSANESNDFMV